MQLGKKERIFHKNKIILLIAVVFFGVFLFFSSGSAKETKPKVPYIVKDACPFECCRYGEWIAESPLKAYKKEGDSFVVSFVIKPDEKFTAIRGNLHVVKSGMVIITKSFEGFKRGGKMYVLSYKGEGYYDVWYKGKVIKDIEKFWSDDISKNEANGILKNSPEMIWWVLIKNKEGKKGWLKLKNISKSGFNTKEKIKGCDACA
ncbi:MAG: hypothetical protein LLF28_07920 [Nitrospiraceae bacterium]|nr:hypothetical protein [Nitrospiraceae bacterium]